MSSFVEKDLYSCDRLLGAASGSEPVAVLEYRFDHVS